jgi:GH15 family glucan-1,4-alpha-glucosidase
MKSLILSILLTTTLSGCAVGYKVYDAFFMAKYDTIEYALTNKVRTLSELAVEDCKDQSKSKDNFEGLYFISVELKNFTQYLPDNPDAHKLAGNLVELTKQGRELYAKGTGVSEGFCRIKLQQINRSAEVAQKVIGKKPR